MGLAERFKDKLNKQNIFVKTEKVEQKKEIQYISNPLTSTIKEDFQSKYKLEDIESQIIEKIRKTPYWEEYSTIQQEKMISSYLDKKSVTNPVTSQERSEFIKNIMSLSNNR